MTAAPLWTGDRSCLKKLNYWKSNVASLFFQVFAVNEQDKDGMETEESKQAPAGGRKDNF